MKLNAPKKNIFIVSVILAALAVVATFVAIPFVTVNAFWFLVVGYVLLMLGNILKGF